MAGLWGEIWGWEGPGKGAALASRAGADLLFAHSLGQCEVLGLVWGARAPLLAPAVALLRLGPPGDVSGDRALLGRL